MHILKKEEVEQTNFGAAINQTDFAVSITSIQFKDPALVIKLRLCTCLYTIVTRRQ